MSAASLLAGTPGRARRRTRTRTGAACLASAERDVRAALFTVTLDGGKVIEVEHADLHLAARKALIERVRRADLAENAGALGLMAGAFLLLWMAARSLPSLFPALGAGVIQ